MQFFELGVIVGAFALMGGVFWALGRVELRRQRNAEIEQQRAAEAGRVLAAMAHRLDGERPELVIWLASPPEREARGRSLAGGRAAARRR